MITANRAKEVIAYAIDQWKKTFAGTSGLAIAAAMSIPHDEVLLILESLANEGKGTLNRNVELCEFTLSISSQSKNLEKRSTHIFFPSKEVLHDAFYQSDLPRQNLPEYERRLHQVQIRLIWCSFPKRFFPVTLVTRNSTTSTILFRGPSLYQVWRTR